MSEDWRRAWAVMFRRVAGDALRSAGREAEAEGAVPAAFADDLGHRRPVDGAFFAWRRRRSGTDDVAVDADDGADSLLWRALTDEGVDPVEVVARVSGVGDAAGRDRTDAGALFGQERGNVPLEVWTERELCCVHALGWLVREDGREALREKLDAVMSWHLENLQPDNATNHPWAAHLFVAWAEGEGVPEARLYAETMLHNCQVGMGRADAFSAHILMDGADWLEASAG